MYVCACAYVSAQVRAFLGGMGRGVEVEVDIPGGWSLIQHASRHGGGGQILMYDHYDQPSNESFCNELEILLYNSALAITGLTQKTSKIKLHDELGLKSLKSRRWSKQLYGFYKIKNFD